MQLQLNDSIAVLTTVVLAADHIAVRSGQAIAAENARRVVVWI